MTVSVIIPSWNGRAQLAQCLASLARQTVAPDEVLVVDNGSTDGTAEWLAADSPRVRVIRSAVNHGFAGGVNRGVQAASGEAFWILNNDVVIDPRCLQALLAGLARSPAQAACSAKILQLASRDAPHARYDAVGDYLTWTGFLYHLGFGEEDRGQYDHLEELFSPKGVCFIIRRAVFQHVGGFDAAFGSYFEESDLFWRIWLAGFRVGFAPEAIVWHEGGGTARRLPSAVIDAYAFRNRLSAMVTNLGTLRLWLILPVHLVCCVGIGLLYVIRGRLRNTIAVLAAIGHTIAHWGALALKRRHVQQVLRKIPDRALFHQHGRPLPIGWGWQFLRVYLRRW
ncbi:MAG: glycosyltransferase family 2 protein [Candidatus Omnitrophica bacterium]|nr:glycosyltransferase family 2 protein [Candidatus Omnitrophota bacterium]